MLVRKGEDGVENDFLDSIYAIILYSSYAVYEAHPW